MNRIAITFVSGTISGIIGYSFGNKHGYTNGYVIGHYDGTVYACNRCAQILKESCKLKGLSWDTQDEIVDDLDNVSHELLMESVQVKT